MAKTFDLPVSIRGISRAIRYLRKASVRFEFDQEVSGKTYVFVIGVDGSDFDRQREREFISSLHSPDFGCPAQKGDVVIEERATGFAAIGEFLSNLDWSPLWVSLRTTGIAIVSSSFWACSRPISALIFSPRAKNICDVIFTIPMVLPPTVCGFLLLYLCGRNTAFGQFWIDVGFPLIFSPRGMRYCGCGGGVPAHVSKRFGRIRELGREYARRGAHIRVEQREDFRSLDAAALMEQHCRGRRAFVRTCARRIRRYSVPRWQLSGRYAHDSYRHLL